MAKKKRAARRKKSTPQSVGLTPDEVLRIQDADAPALAKHVEGDGGAVLATYRDPFGGATVLLVALPIDRVEPTPFQRDPSEPHVKRLMTVLEKVGRFLDPIIMVRHDDRYWTPNGNHRLQAMRKLGAKTIVGLLLPEADIAFKILALNTEKAHNVKEKSLETIRMARALAERKAGNESDHAFEFEMAPYLTLGAAYDTRRSLSGGAYMSVLRRIDDFLDEPMPKALARARAARREGAEAGRCRGGSGGRAQGARHDQSLLEGVRRRAREPDPLFEVDRVRLRRGDGQDDRRGAAVQGRKGAPGRSSPRRRRSAGRRLTADLTQHVAGLGLPDHRVGVRLQQIAVSHQRGGRGADGLRRTRRASGSAPRATGADRRSPSVPPWSSRTG